MFFSIAPKGRTSAYPVPRIGLARSAADGFVPFEEARQEELPGQRGQFHAAPGVVVHQLVGLVGFTTRSTARGWGA